MPRDFLRRVFNILASTASSSPHNNHARAPVKGVDKASRAIYFAGMDIKAILYEAAKLAEAAMLYAAALPEKRPDIAPWMGRELASMLDLGVVSRLLPELIEVHERVCDIQAAFTSSEDEPSLPERIGAIERRLESLEEKIGRIHEVVVDDREPPWSSR